MAVLINKSSGCSGIFKLLFLPLASDLRLTGGYLRMSIQIGDHRIEPMFRHFNIGVQKYHIFRFDLLQSQIISIRKAMILIEHNDSDSRKFFPEHLHRSIRRAIVGYTDFYLSALRTADHRRKKSTKHIAPVPIQNNYRYFHHHPLSHSALEAFQRLCDHSQ